MLGERLSLFAYNCVCVACVMYGGAKRVTLLTGHCSQLFSVKSEKYVRAENRRNMDIHKIEIKKENH